VTRISGAAARRAGAILLAALLCAWGAVGVASPAAAHASLLRTDPADGAELAAAPTTTTLEFSEPVSIGAAGLRLFSADGDPIELTARAVDGTVTAALPSLADDARYIIAWQVVSSDAHVIAGTIAFAVGDPPAGGAPVAELPEDGAAAAWATAAGAAQLLGLLVTAGLLLFELLALRRPIGTRVTRVTLVAAATLAAAGAVGVAVVAEVRTGGPTWAPVVGAGLAGAAALLAWLRTPDRLASPWLTAAAILALASPVLVGHSASREPRWLIVGGDLVHLGAGAVWVGGVVGLGCFLVAASRRDDDGRRVVRPQDAAEVVGRFSAVAAIAAGALVISGTTMAVVVLGSWEALLGTVYGRLLLLKVGLVAVALGLAVWTRWRLVPAIRTRPDAESAWSLLRGQLLREGVVLALVVVLTGALTGQSPNLDPGAATGGATGPADEPAAGSEAAPGAGLGTATAVSASADGVALVGTVSTADGVARLEFTLRDDDGTPVDPVEAPTVSARLPALELGPIATTAEPTGEPGTFEVALALPVAGEWTVDVGVRRTEFQQRTLRITVTLP